MHVLLVAGLGICVVLTAILALKLHPFLALIAGALTVLLLTPQSSWLRSDLEHSCITVIAVDRQTDSLQLSRPLENAELGRDYLLWSKSAELPDARVVRLSATTQTLNSQPAFTIVQLGQVKSDTHIASGLNTRAGDWILSQSDYQSAVKRWARTRFSGSMKRLSAGLSGTFEQIGLSIVMAAIIGVCLLESGAAVTLVNWLVQRLGEKRTAPALMISGFVLGVPIFFDTVFYLLLPLARAFGKKSPDKRLLAIMSIIVGATMAHSLVPPTPGPLLVANRLGVSIGTMMIAGTIVGGAAACVGFAYGWWCNLKMAAELADSAPLEPAPSVVERDAGEKSEATSPGSRLPIWLAMLPLAIPIVGIGGIEIGRSLEIIPRGEQISNPLISELVDLLANPSFVLMISAAVSLALLRRSVSAKRTQPLVVKGIADAGTILLLTCAGGAFGAALKQLHLAEAIADSSQTMIAPHSLLIGAFLLTALIRIAQGSATVAMITAVGIVSPFVQGDSNLPFHTVYLALAIGCGAKMMPWMNDSGFWQVSSMSGLTVGQTLRTFSAALSIMGLVGMGITLVGAWVLPLK